MNTLHFATAEIQPSGPLFDAEAVLARVEGDRRLLRPVVGLFAKQWSKLCAQIARVGQHHNGSELELTANQLNRSVGSVGADKASRVAQELEMRGRTGDFHDLEEACAAMKMEIDRLVNALEEFSSNRSY